MIADGARRAVVRRTRYRGRVRTSSTALWLLLGLAVVAVLVSRASRSMGSVGIILTIALVIVFLGLARELLRAHDRSDGSGFYRWRATTKNVTPHEPALPPGAGPSPSPDAAPAPSVIVVEPPDATDRLSARLQALDRLRADGLVTADEYEAKRAQLIADF